MSLANERRGMVELLPAYALMTVTQLAKHLSCSADTARAMIDGKVIPSIRIGGRRMVDPVDVVAYELAEREGMTTAQWWAINGDAAIDLVRKHINRIRRLVA